MKRIFNMLLIFTGTTINSYSQMIVITDSFNCKFDLIYDLKDVSIENNRNTWRFLINNCPESTKLTYINGDKIFSQLICEESDSLTRERLIDTLLLNYDLRIKYFLDSSMILEKKAIAIIKYTVVR